MNQSNPQRKHKRRSRHEDRRGRDPEPRPEPRTQNQQTRLPQENNQPQHTQKERDQHKRRPRQPQNDRPYRNQRDNREHEHQPSQTGYANQHRSSRRGQPNVEQDHEEPTVIEKGEPWKTNVAKSEPHPALKNIGTDIGGYRRLIIDNAIIGFLHLTEGYRNPEDAFRVSVLPTYKMSPVDGITNFGWTAALAHRVDGMNTHSELTVSSCEDSVAAALQSLLAVTGNALTTGKQWDYDGVLLCGIREEDWLQSAFNERFTLDANRKGVIRVDETEMEKARQDAREKMEEKAGRDAWE